MLFTGSNHEFLRVEEIDANNFHHLKEQVESSLTLLWFLADGSELTIDNKHKRFHKSQVLCLTEFHQLSVVKVSKIRMVRFNRPFYCIVDHDSEVGCKGILFFGASQLPVFNLDASDLQKLTALWDVFVMEMDSFDHLQQEMLQMLLKRLLILCTRIYKEQTKLDILEHTTQDIVREFNFLVELHFRSKHTVAEYADLLHKSPKTLSNVFSKIGSKTPLQYIRDRRMLEARRLLKYTDKQIKEIAYETGFDSLQTFSRFFKKCEGVSPKEFKAQA
jgi:AraC-like DNA-binding protein